MAEQTDSCSKKVGRKFKNLDIYGHQISLTYKGSDTFKTKLGALISVIVRTMLLAFASYKFNVLANKIEPDVSLKDNKRDLGKEPAFIPNKYGFDFAIGMRGGDLPSKYGYYRVRHVNF